MAASTIGCPGAGRGDGLEVSKLPPETRADYAVFAQRCSKCHSLARPLESGITEDSFWVAYVSRMRRQPSSGISPADEVPILRFLHYYSETQRHRDEATPATPATPARPAAPVRIDEGPDAGRAEGAK
jgi:hypothetical protein